MAAPLTSKKLLTHANEVAYGTMIEGAITNGDWDIELGPGFWYIALFVNANTVSAGTVAALLLDGDGNVAEEGLLVCLTAGSPNSTASLIDLVGAVHVCASTSTGAQGVAPVPVYSKIRFTIASIAGAGATNRVYYIAQRAA